MLSVKLLNVVLFLSPAGGLTLTAYDLPSPLAFSSLPFVLVVSTPHSLDTSRSIRFAMPVPSLLSRASIAAFLVTTLIFILYPRSSGLPPSGLGAFSGSKSHAAHNGPSIFNDINNATLGVRLSSCRCIAND